MDTFSPDPPESRYARHALMDWWDQKRLAEARVLVAGAGALGNEVIKSLALLGVGHLWIVDFDRIALSNLTRSVLFRESDVGRGKAEVAAERARQFNPDVEIHALAGDLEFDVGLGVYRAMDVVIGCLDSINARLALNRACRRVGVPWLNGGIEDTLGEVALFGSRTGACFECGMSPTLWELRNQRFSCGGLRNALPEDAAPTTAVIASIVAGYLVNEAVLLLHKAGAEKEGLKVSQKLYLTLKPYSFTITNLPVNVECLAHEFWEPIEILPQSPQEWTASGLLHAMSAPDGLLELGFDLLTEMRCLECGETETILRPAERCSVALNACPRCHALSRQPETLHWLDASSPLANLPLAQLGAPEYHILAVKDDKQRRYVQLTGEFPA